MLQCLSIHALAGIILCAAWCAHAESAWHHDLDVRLDPAQEHLTVEDTLLAPPAFKGHSLCWSLNAQLAIQHSEPRSMAAKPLGGDAMRYCTELAVDGERFSVRYAGVLPKPRDAPTESVRALVAPDWVYLDPNGGWYPHHADELASVRLAVHLPAGWRAVTQGVRLQRTETADGVLEVWEERQAQEGLYLIAAPFHEYQGAAVPAQALVFLRADDEALARRYLDATQRYLDFYGRLLGPYAYGKFALVENNWDSGFGMPSFTLLGPRVIRLPFLLESSYPHEILHNWWGNGVYVNDQSGNWSEGLTSYLADYLIAEQQGRGTEYRRNTLQRYLNYVGAARDFPLAEFRARHSEASQSVGYDKGLMFFHMLRRRLGDAVFVEGLRRFYHDQRGQRAGFDDLRLAWESTGNQNLQSDFAAWLTQPGAPALRLRDVQARPDGQGYRLSATFGAASRRTGLSSGCTCSRCR
ncbi:MAG: M1 family aminopeptidase [Gammaproteobacteria bacterium]